MNCSLSSIVSHLLTIAAVAVCSTESLATTFKHVTLTGQSDSGFTYSGTGSQGLPGTTNPDSRRRARVYSDFSSFDTSNVGDKIKLTYDVLLGGSADPSNVNNAWRFGFINTSANGGKGVSLGLNLDIGDLAGTSAYEFFTDRSVTSGLGTPPSGTMDAGFSDTLNDPADLIARIGQVNSNTDPFADNVALNDRMDTSRIMLTLERIVDGYNLSMTWQNLTSGNTLSHSYALTTSDADPTAAAAASITSWNRLGFFINADTLPDSSAYAYTISNLAVTGNMSAIALPSTWTPNEYQIPEPSSACLALFGLATFAGAARRRRR